jgi:hypothetical protein
LPRRSRSKSTRWSARGSQARKATVNDGLKAVFHLAADGFPYTDELSHRVDQGTGAMWLLEEGSAPMLGRNAVK